MTAPQERPVWTGEPCRTCGHSPHNHYGSLPAHCALFGCGCPAYDGQPQERPVAGDGLDRIAAERRRQIEVEGWTPEHDAEHDSGEMIQAASSYLHHAVLLVRDLRGYVNGALPPEWPWSEEWWKDADPVRSLEKAGALIAAEIDRLQAAPNDGSGAEGGEGTW